MKKLLSFALLGLLFATQACDNDCSYDTQCDGNTLLTCGEGPDQMFGRRVHPVACPDSNPICIETSDSEALCVHSNKERCDHQKDNPKCEGTYPLQCDQSGYWVSSSECVEGRALCRMIDEEPICIHDPVEKCNSSEPKWECRNGIVAYCSTELAPYWTVNQDCIAEDKLCTEKENGPLCELSFAHLFFLGPNILLIMPERYQTSHLGKCLF